MGLPIDRDGSVLKSPRVKTKSILNARKPLVCIDVKVGDRMLRIDVFKNDDYRECVSRFVKIHGLLPQTEQYLYEKVVMHRNKAL